MAELVGGMQALVDAALAHRTPRRHPARPRGPGARRARRGRGDHLPVDESGRLSVGASTPGEHAGGDEFAAWVAESREAILAEDDSLIGVPLLAEGVVTGVLVAGAEPPREFSGEDLTLLRLAPPSGSGSPSRTRACTSASTGSRRRSSAACCPTACPSCPGLEVAARYLPAASEAEVGGDWYDVIPIAGGAVGLVMGDVAGKGLAGASMVGAPAQRAARVRARGPRRRASWSASTGSCGPRPRRARWRRCCT